MREQVYWMSTIIVAIIAILPIILALYGASPQIVDVFLKIAALPTTVSNLVRNSMSFLKYVSGY